MSELVINRSDSETRIRATVHNQVSYEMEPYIADELAAILQRAATKDKAPGKWDQGWLDDASSLIEASNEAADPEGWGGDG